MSQKCDISVTLGAKNVVLGVFICADAVHSACHTNISSKYPPEGKSFGATAGLSEKKRSHDSSLYCIKLLTNIPVPIETFGFAPVCCQ
jgi:hypothetical protein